MERYHQLIEKLFNANRGKGIHLGLAHVHAMHTRIGSPAELFQTIHVAGTNGKGSVSTKIAAACRAQGYRTGLFTSPHLSTFRERILIDGEMISEEEVEALLPTLFEKCPEATFFEMTTLLAFAYFAKHKVDIAVIETGLGGRFDATNIITPLLSIITSIGLDHCDILGDTIEKIAFEKAGIIKNKVPVVIGPCVPREGMENTAKKKGSPFLIVEGEYLSFNEENNAIVRAALEYLKFSPEAIAKGLKAVAPCRMEILSLPACSAPLILDVAHNPNGLQRLFAALKDQYPRKRFRVLCGLSKEKDLAQCLQLLAAHASHLHLVQSTNARSAPIEVLAQVLEPFSSHYSMHSVIADGIEALLTSLAEGEIPVVCGSFFIMGAVKKALGMNLPSDAFDMNEQSLYRGINQNFSCSSV